MPLLLGPSGHPSVSSVWHNAISVKQIVNPAEDVSVRPQHVAFSNQVDKCGPGQIFAMSINCNDVAAAADNSSSPQQFVWGKYLQ